MGMAHVHRAVLGKLLKYALNGLVADVVAVDEERNFVVVVHRVWAFPVLDETSLEGRAVNFHSEIDGHLVAACHSLVSILLSPDSFQDFVFDFFPTEVVQYQLSKQVRLIR